MEPPTGADASAQQLMARFGAMLPIPFSVLDANGDSVYANPEYCALVGLPLEQVMTRSLQAAVHPDDVDTCRDAMARVTEGQRVEVELRALHRDGHWLQIVWGMQYEPDEELVLIVALNVTDHRRLTRQLRHEADHDALTGAANRSLVMRSLHEWADAHLTIMVAIIDVDGFKLVNDRMGHRVGDAVLRGLVGRLRQLVPDDALVGRMGGDEFVVLAPTRRPEALEELAAQLTHVSGPIRVLEREVQLSASIGVTSGSDTDPEQLLHQADVAAYVAKRQGRGRVQRYDETLRAEDALRQRIERHLVEALDGDGVTLHLQPIVSLADGAMLGAEALARVQGPEGLIEAVDFIDVADDLGVMRRIAQRVQLLALQSLSDLPSTVRLFLNTDSEDLLGVDGLQGIVDLAASHGVAPDRLVLELKETTLLRDVDATVRQLRAVRAQGVGIAVDEFGAGLSSLSQVSRLPVDLLKVHRSFVAAARADPAARAVLAAVTGIGPALGVDVVLEGVETESDLVLARHMEVSAVQGWQLGSPMSSTALADNLADRRG